MPDITIKVSFLGELRRLVKRREMEVTLSQGSTVRALIEQIRVSFPEAFDGRAFDEQGDICSHVSIFLNEKNLDRARGLDTILEVGGEVDLMVLPIYEGGDATA